MLLRSIGALASLALSLALMAPGLSRATALETNLIANGDAEAGTTGWAAFDGVAALQTQRYADLPEVFLYPDAPHGESLFTGSTGGLAAGWQLVQVADLASTIDAGHVGFRLAAYLGGVGNQEDNTLLYVSFLDATGLEIAHTELGPVYLDLRDYLTVLGGFRTEGVLPGGTRTIQFSLSMDAPDGDSRGAFADKLDFRLVSAVPEPQTAVLMALGLLALGGKALRRISR